MIVGSTNRMPNPLLETRIMAAIEDGMDRLAVLVFHDQFVTDEQQLAFSKNFGAIEVREALYALDHSSDLVDGHLRPLKQVAADSSDALLVGFGRILSGR